jgi:plastocyanin
MSWFMQSFVKPQYLTSYYTRWHGCFARVGLLFFLTCVPLWAEEPHLRSLQEQAGSGPMILIRMESYRYIPDEISLEEGQAVTLILQNESFLVPHNFLLDDPDGNRIVEIDVSSGKQVTVAFKPAMAGIYPFYCDKKLLFFPSHRDQGMEGRIVVRKP